MPDMGFTKVSRLVSTLRDPHTTATLAQGAGSKRKLLTMEAEPKDCEKGFL